MTEVLQNRGKSTSAGTNAPDGPSEPTPQTPAADLTGYGRGRDGRPRLTISHLFSTVGILLVAFAVLAGLAMAMVVSWLRGAADDAARWSAAHADLDEIHELVTQQYLDANQSIRNSFGWYSVYEEEGEAISEEIDELLSDLAAISDDPQFADRGTRLQAASADLIETAVTGMEEIDSGEPGASSRVLLRLDLAFGGWRARHVEFTETMDRAEAAALEGQSTRADNAATALTVLTVVAVVVFGGALYLGRQARIREQSLQRQIEDEKELLDTMVNQIPDPIAWKDGDLRLLGCNESMLERFRALGVDTPFGERVSEQALPPKHAERVADVEAMESEVIATGQPILGRQVSIINPDGPDRTVIRSSVPLVHKNKVVGVISTTRDVTQLIDLERSLAAATRLESIGQLAAGIAHEINTPVQFVSDNTAFLNDSFGELITAIERLSNGTCECNRDEVATIKEETDLDFLLEEIPDAVTQSREGLEHIARIVQAMKDFAHPGGDAGPTDINRLVQSVVDVSRNEWKYDADMKVDLADELPEPHSDGGQIKQVVLNMIVNAAHAIADSEREKGLIEVTTSSNNGSVLITIKDDGAGIPEDVRPRIFERFFTTKEVGRGSGQGLAIAYDAVTSHGGTINVESTVGVGSTFTIELPIEAPQGQPTPR